MATLDKVLDQMAMADMPPLPPGHPILDGAIHRYGPKKKCWYQLHEFAGRGGIRVIVGAFGRWSGTDNGKIPVKADFTGMQPDEYQRLQKSQAELQRREREKREGRVRFAAQRALDQWNKARARPAEGESHPYLIKKQLRWENGLRLAPDGMLYVPLVRYDVTEEQVKDPDYTGPRRLAGLQKIPADGGDKKFNYGTDPIGASCRFGRKPKDGDLLLLGEGLATVLSVHQGLERAYTSFVAFTAGNLLPVARMLRQLYPKSPILLLADDDAYLEAQLNKTLRTEWGVREIFKVVDVDRELASEKFGRVHVAASVHEDAQGVPVLTAGVTRTLDGKAVLRTVIRINTGRTKANEAAAEVKNAWVAWPRFENRELKPDPDAPRLTDFNDLHCAEGMESLVLQVGEQVQRVRDAIELAHAVAAGVAPSDEAGAGGGDGGADDGTDWKLHWSLLGRFTQIYPSDTAYDAEKGRVVKIEHMRLRFGSKPVSMWLGSRRKRVIDPNQLVFDPTNSNEPGTVNLFRGLPEQAREGGECKLLLELIHYLCGENHEDTQAPITTWLLRWLAYPLQNLGAKMQTAVVIHGEEGTGKNMIFGTVRKMYGRHGGVITQRQLEDKFNTWQSAKLFVVANEVVTRQEMTHQAGFIRNLITEPEIQINPKFQDQREEANHMNIAFLANALQPLLLGLKDRRCLVIRTPDPRDEAFYKAVGAELKAGGVAAFYRYLMNSTWASSTSIRSRP